MWDSRQIKIGSKVRRMLAGEFPMEMIVSEITEDRVICGSWEFDKATGAEIDDELQWGPKFGGTGSYLILAKD